MARKKKIKILENVDNKDLSVKTVKAENKEKNISIVLGLLVVIFVGFLAFNFFNKLNRNKDSRTLNEKKDVDSKILDKDDVFFYTVLEGDTLWSISEKFYQDGFSWKKIADANKITSPEEIEKGTILIIPNTQIKKGDINGDGVSIAAPIAITDSTYKVMPGDDLWDIAVRACGDGYKWVKIAEDNKLTNPDIIHVENILKINCKSN